MRFELFPHGEGFGYNIYNDANAIIVSQNFNPKEPGFVYMDSETASAMALSDIANMTQVVDGNSESPTQQQVSVNTSQIGHVDFLMRLTQAERKEFNRLTVQVEIDYAAAVKAGTIQESLEDMYDFLNMFKKASYIDLSFEPTIQGVTWIGSAFLGMTAERIAEILKP